MKEFAFAIRLTFTTIVLFSGCASQPPEKATAVATGGGAGLPVRPVSGSGLVVDKVDGTEKPANQARAAAQKVCAQDTTLNFDSPPYYEGQLIDAHMHMPSLFPAPPGTGYSPAVLGSHVTMDEIICRLDREGIRKAIGFFLVLDFLLEPSLDVPRGTENKYPGRIAPFLMPAPLTKPTLAPEVYGSVAASNPGLFKGYGELPFYFPVFRGKSPDDAEFMQVFKVADMQNHAVMIHPTPETIESMEIAIQQNPEVIFLLHGTEVEDEIARLAEKYSNVYVSLDATLFPMLYGSDSKEAFKSEFSKGFDSMLKGGIAKWKVRIEANPDSFVWGTDRGESWHFDEEVGSYLVEFGRAFIARLSPEVQEKFAFRNAENLLAGKKTGAKATVMPITKSPFTGMEGLCASEAKCNEFCKDNYGRCRQYCDAHQDYKLCRDGFSFQ